MDNENMVIFAYRSKSLQTIHIFAPSFDLSLLLLSQRAAKRPV